MDGGDCLRASNMLKSAYLEHRFANGVPLPLLQFALMASADVIAPNAAKRLREVIYCLCLLIFGPQMSPDGVRVPADAGMRWCKQIFGHQEAAWYMAALLHTLADNNMDGEMSMLEAVALFPAMMKDKQAFKVLATSLTDSTSLAGPSGAVPVEALLQALSVGRTLFGVGAAGLELSSGVPADVADAVFLLLDGNDDQSLSEMELSPLAMSEELLKMMMAKEQGEGMSLHAWRALQIEPVTDCSKLVVVSKAGPIDIATLWLPHGRCNILVMPPVKVPAEYETHSDAACGVDASSGSGCQVCELGMDVDNSATVAGGTCYDSAGNVLGTSADPTTPMHTPDLCAQTGGSWSPYTCEDLVTWFATSVTPGGGCDSGVEYWSSSICCKKASSGSGCQVCELGMDVDNSATVAGGTCYDSAGNVLGTSADPTTPMHTPDLCAQTGGSWSPYTCEEMVTWFATSVTPGGECDSGVEYWSSSICCNKDVAARRRAGVGVPSRSKSSPDALRGIKTLSTYAARSHLRNIAAAAVAGGAGAGRRGHTLGTPSRTFKGRIRKQQVRLAPGMRKSQSRPRPQSVQIARSYKAASPQRHRPKNAQQRLPVGGSKKGLSPGNHGSRTDRLRRAMTAFREGR